MIIIIQTRIPTQNQLNKTMIHKTRLEELRKKNIFIKTLLPRIATSHLKNSSSSSSWHHHHHFMNKYINIKKTASLRNLLTAKIWRQIYNNLQLTLCLITRAFCMPFNMYMLPFLFYVCLSCCGSDLCWVMFQN